MFLGPTSAQPSRESIHKLLTLTRADWKENLHMAYIQTYMINICLDKRVNLDKSTEMDVSMYNASWIDR